MLNGIRRFSALAITAAVIVSACSSSGASPSPTAASSNGMSAAPSAGMCVTGSITSGGSTALQPLVDAAAKQYVAACQGATISVQGGGSGTGLSQVSQGAFQIGASDVLANTKLSTPAADALVDHIVAKQGWIMVTNKGVTGVTNLTTAQAHDIWTGKTTNWKGVGGPDMPIVVILRPSSSGTRATFKKIVLGGDSELTGGQTLTEDSNGAVTTAVSKTDGSVSVIGFAYYIDPTNKAQLNGLQLDGVDATTADMSAGTYKLSADGHLYTKGEATGLSKAFLDYMMSSAIQATLIPNLGYGPVVH